MEIVIMLFVLVGGSLAYSSWKKNKSSNRPESAVKHEYRDNSRCVRKCFTCGHEGEMKIWISNYNIPKIIVIAGFLLGYIPGLIFLAIYWGKYKCPSCGSIGKNQQIKVLLAAVAAFMVVQSVNLFAVELPNMKKISAEDKIFFGSRINVDQFKKVQQIINHSKISMPPCEKAVEINKTLRLLKEIKPIFQEASTSAGISLYARKYSAALAQELTETSKALIEILPHYKDACATSTVSQKDAGMLPRQSF